MEKIVFFIALVGGTVATYSQEYYTSDFTFFQEETNPSSVATSKMDNVIKSSFLFAKKFSQQEAWASTYFPRQFIGLGLSAGNVNVSNQHYQKAGLSIAYRNILFSKIKIRGGLHYKFIKNHSSSGTYSYYSFEEQNLSRENSTLHNTNFSISLTDLANRFYLVAGKLNFPILGIPQNTFKTYDYITIGNLINRFNSVFRPQVSYSLVQTNSLLGKKLNHVLTFVQQIRISRKITALLSGKIGYWDNSIYQVKPGISIYKPSVFSHVDGLVKVAVDLGIDKFNQSLGYPPILETTIQLKF